MQLIFKHETISAYKSFKFYVQLDKVLFYEAYVWEPSTNYLKLLLYGSGALMRDSINLNGTSFKDVGESGAIKFIQDDPNRMESQSMKIFLNPEIGPLQFDFRDRLTGELKVRLQLMSSFIIR